MKPAGNCPTCGNPIYATCPSDVQRTCYCVFPRYAPPPYVAPAPYPYWRGPYYGANTGVLVTHLSKQSGTQA